MALVVEPYSEQIKVWPKEGHHILAQYDDDTIIVYQAYRPSIGQFVVNNGVFGGGFSYSRMSWVKPNFLWMMYRSAWGTKDGQEVTLALRLRRQFFDGLLAQAVPSLWDPDHFAREEDWAREVRRSCVRMQWIQIITRPGRSWSGVQSSSGCGAKYWRRSGGGSWSKFSTFPSSSLSSGHVYLRAVYRQLSHPESASISSIIQI